MRQACADATEAQRQLKAHQELLPQLHADRRRHEKKHVAAEKVIKQLEALYRLYAAKDGQPSLAEILSVDCPGRR